MKIKRNKRVEQNLKIRAARSAGKEHAPVLSLHRMREILGISARKPKSFLVLLEQDLAAQSERLQRLERAISLEPGAAGLTLAPAFEPVSDFPSETPVAEEPAEPSVETEDESSSPAAGGRTNYQYVASSQRVRRRIIM